MRRRLTALVVLAILAVLGWFGWYASTPVELARFPAEFSIASGSTLRKTAQDFETQGLIRHPAAFVALARVLGQAGKIKAGSYMAGGPMSPYQLLNKITLGETLLAKVTVIEGWSFRQMRAALDLNPRLRHDTAGLSDAELLRVIGATELHPEGLFFPDTYYFDPGSSDLDIYRRAYHTLAVTLSALWQGRAEGLPFQSPYQALILASVVEKETGAPDERPLIAAVFLNRMRLGMRLQTDPTVIYGMGAGFDGNLRKVDLVNDTPYNSYTRAGLPPTPIALPSAEAIRAVLHPDQSKALYFVAKGGGRHQFSETLDEHNRAVNRYQRGGRG